MGAKLDTAFGENVVGHLFETIRIEGGGIADGMWRGRRVEIEETPACPATPALRQVALIDLSVVLIRHDAEVFGAHALDHLGADALNGDLQTIHHIIQHKHHAASSQAAEIRIALDERD